MPSQFAPVYVRPIVTAQTTLYKETTLADGTTHADLVTTAVASDFSDCVGFSCNFFYVDNGITTSVIFTVQGSLDGTNFETISYRLLSSGVYAEAAVTVVGSAKDVLHFSPTEYFRYLRVNVSTQYANGTRFTLYSQT
mgnify:CR=1 FL=1